MKKSSLLTIIIICLIATMSISAYATNFSIDNKVATNPRLHVYPRYRNEMDAGELAYLIYERLGFKLKADFEGDEVDGSVTVNSTNVIIEFYYDVELTPKQKAELNETVQSHHSKHVEKCLRKRSEEPVHKSDMQDETVLSTSNDPAFGEAHQTSMVSTTSISWISLDLEVPAIGVAGMWGGYHIFADLSVEACNTEGRIDFRIRRGVHWSKYVPTYNEPCPIDIYFFGNTPSWWTRTLHGYTLNCGYYYGWAFVRAEWKVAYGTGYALYRIISVMVFAK